jgi:hypothetical protein
VKDEPADRTAAGTMMTQIAGKDGLGENSAPKKCAAALADPADSRQRRNV